LFFSLENSSASIVNVHGIVEANSFAHWSGVFKDGPSESHIYTLCGTAQAALGGEHDLSQECGSSSLGTHVVLGTYWLGGWTFGLTFTIVIGTSWLALVIKSVCVTVEALSVLCYTRLTLTSNTSITVNILRSNLTLIRDLLTFVEVGVTLFSGLTVSVIIAPTHVGFLAHWCGVWAVDISSTACATLVSRTIILFERILSGTVEAVIIRIHITDGIISITFAIQLAHWLAGVVLAVESIKTVSIRCTSTSVGILVTNWCRVFTIQSTVMATFTTSIIGSTVSATEEAVVIVCITDLIISLTFSVCSTLCYTGVVLAVESLKTVSIVGTSTGVGILVTYRCGVLTIQSTVVATFTTSIVGATIISSTVETIVMVCITDLVISLAEVICVTDSLFTEMSVLIAEIAIRTVLVIIQSSTSSQASSSFSTVGTVVRVMGSRNITDSIVVVTIRVLGTLTGSRIDTLEEYGAVASITLVTVRVLTAFIFRQISVTCDTTLNVGRPITDRSKRILITWIKCESPLVIAK